MKSKIEYDIMMSTIDRPNNQYLFQTLSSFGLQSSELRNFTVTPNLVVGNQSISYLDNFKKHNTSIIPMTEAEWNLVKDKGNCEKFNLNFYRCLTKSDLNTLYLEDDIVFEFGWDLKLKQQLEILHEEYEDFVLSIYSAYDLSSSSTDLITFNKGFFGTQGVYFTQGIKEDFASKIMSEGIVSYRHMADLLLQEFCNDNKIPLFVMKKSIIQHIGTVSSIHTNNFHSAKNF